MIPDLIIAAGVVRKRPAPEPIPVVDLYLGPLWDARRAYVEKRSKDLSAMWAIVSAKHGIIYPADKVCGYQAQLPSCLTSAWFEWRARVIRGLNRVLEIDRAFWVEIKTATIEVHASRQYVEALARVLGPKAKLVHPIRHMSVKEMTDFYREQIDG